MAAPKKATKKDFVMVGDDVKVQEMIEPVLKEFGVQYDELDDLIGQLLANTIANLSTVVPQVLNILSEKKLYDEITVIAKEIGLKSSESCQCVAEKLVKDKSMWQKFCSFFLDRLKGQMGPNKGDDITPETVAEYIEAFQEKMDNLETTVGPDAYQKSLDWVNRVHIVFSVISLGISWKFLWDSAWAIDHASKTIEQIRIDLDALRKNKIKPIFQFLTVTKRKGHITLHEYERYCDKIEAVVDILNEKRKQVAVEKSNMQNKAVNNTISAVTMGLSMFSSFGLNAVNPSKALQVIGVLQGATAATNVVVAGLSMSMYNKLNTLDNDLRKEIEKLNDIKKELAEYLEPAVMDHIQCDAYSWDNATVVQWVQGIDSKTAKVFKDVGVEGPDLLDMDDATLDSIGVGLFHRKKLLRKIKELKQ